MRAILQSPFWIRSFLIIALLGLSSYPSISAQDSPTSSATSAEATALGIEGEFFSDLTGKISKRDGVEISRTLRIAAESSRIQPMLVVIPKMSDYPTMPQELSQFAKKLAEDWKVGDVDTKKGVLVIFSLEDHKYGAVTTGNLPTTLADSIKQSFHGRTLADLKEGKISAAMKVAADAVASNLPKASALAKTGALSPTNGGTNPASKTVTRTTRVRPPGMAVPGSNIPSQVAPASGIQMNHPQHASGGFSSWGWIALLVAGGIFLFIFMAIISMFSSGSRGYGPPAGGGYYGGGGAPMGGYGGGGGMGSFLGGMATGGLLGYMFGGGSHSGWGSGWGGSAYGADHHNVSETTTTETWNGGGNDANDAGSGYDAGGGYDSFGGGNYDGGGSSFGEW